MENIILTGFYDLDYLTKGIKSTELVLIGGRAGMGKTTVALSIARNVVLKQNIPTVYFSLEMSKFQVLNRINTLSINKVAADLIIDDTPALTVEELSEKCRRLKVERHIGLIIIDYLQLLKCENSDKSRSRWNIKQLARSMWKLKQLAKELHIPILVTTQLFRTIDRRENHRPILKDLRAFGTMEQAVDKIIFLYRDEYYNKDTMYKGIIELNLAKSSRGKTGTVWMAFIGDVCIVANLSNGKKYEIKIDEIETDQIRRSYLEKGYDLIDEELQTIDGRKIRKCYFSKKENGVWSTLCVTMEYINE